MKTMTYKETGVDYSTMDPFKRMAQLSAGETSGNIERLNGGEFKEVTASRGETAYVIEAGDRYLAHVEETLGTKNLVADAMYALTGKTYYDNIAQDAVAMVVNDIVGVGALPLSMAMHLAVGASDWFEDEKRSQDLVNGWKRACDLARCAWGGGETPTLKGIVDPKAVVLSGSAFGVVIPKERLIVDRIQHGDVMVFVESSGIHANGLTMARKIAEKLPDGYLTKLSDERSYGEALLDPTHIYVPLIEDCQNAGVDIHYVANITGHGWRKLMRATRPFTYVVEELPKQLPIFDFMQEHGPINDREAYGDFNMGVGFALYVKESDAIKVIRATEGSPFRAHVAGHIEDGEKKVIIKPKNLEYAGDTLTVR